MKTKNTADILPILVLIILLCLGAVSASAQSAPAYEPVTAVDLGVKQLTLEPGETYRFTITYEPEVPAFYTLRWTVTDDSIIEIDPVENTVTAKKPGEARILAESLDGVSFTTCGVTVNGTLPKDAKAARSGSVMLAPSAADLKKITSGPLNRYIDFVEASTYSAAALKHAGERVFNVTAHVRPGTEKAESRLASALGMTEADPLPYINAVALQGTLSQILEFIRDNDDLLTIFGGESFFIPDPIEEESAPKSPADMNGHVEDLTSVSTAHNFGYDGTGTVVAVLDTGLNPDHPWFKDRIIGQRCFSTSQTSGDVIYRNVCVSANNAAPGNANLTKPFEHGAHVTGIAAGKDGIAPGADIVAVQMYSEMTWACTATEAQNHGCSDYSTSGRCCKATCFGTDLDRALNYVLELKDQGTDIIAVNMSTGALKYDSECDADFPERAEIFKNVANAGMLPVVSSGNDAYNGFIGYPACLSASYAVGALANLATPLIRPTSNHSPMVKILAPGSNITSASYPSGTTVKSGTSMAAPVVTGALAVLQQASPDKDLASLKNDLQNKTDVHTNKRSSSASSDNGTGVEFTYSKPVVNFGRIAEYAAMGKPKLLNIRAAGKKMTIKFINGKHGTGYSVYVTEADTEKPVDAEVTRQSSGDYLTCVVSGLKNGQPYKIEIQPYRFVNGRRERGPAAYAFGIPNPMLKGFTATPGDKSATFRLIPYGSAYMDSLTYSVFHASDGKMVWNKTVYERPWSQTVTGLKNGHLYYATVNASKVFENISYAGITNSKVYFVPLSKPANAKAVYSNGKMTVSMTDDSAATGISVYFRTLNGGLKKGCEAKGSSCSISGLSKNVAYQFQVMKYKTVHGKKHFGPGTLINYKGKSSGLKAPQKPLIRMQPGNKYLFAIPVQTGAEGFVVYYRVNQGNFQKACQGKRSTSYNDLRCIMSDTVDTTQDYTFYIMLYKTVDGKKVWSPGITANNWLAPN